MTAWLLTWLWQGSALTAAVAVVLRYASRCNAATRHLMWCGALAAVAWLGWASSPFTAPAATSILAAAEPIYIPSAPDSLISTVIGVWATIALLGLLRIARSLGAVYAVRQGCRPFPHDVESLLPLWLEVKGRGRRAELMVCDTLPGATLLGFHRPCIALPASLIETLTISELDQVILHEHAHVQRRDDWTTLSQMLLLAFVCVHPAALYISRVLSREREMACDEWVIARTGAPKEYARCLAHAAEARVRLGSGPMLVPMLLGSRNDLVQRVDRVLRVAQKVRRDISIAAAVAAACALVIMSMQLRAVRGFSELAVLALPHVSRPLLSHRDTPSLGSAAPDAGAAPVVPAAPIAGSSSDAAAARFAPTQRAAPPTQALPMLTPSQMAASDVPAEPNLSARAFPGAYAVTQKPMAASAEHSSTWRAVSAPGIEIASAAKKTSIGIADAFSRAGVALARSF